MKVVLSGYGKMGKMIEEILSLKGIECAGKSEEIQTFDKTEAKQCVCVDFTVPPAFRENYKFLAENFKAVVVGTTGWYDIKEDVFSYFDKCGTPLIWASNFSVGVNVLHTAAALIAKLLNKSGGYTPYIIEKHHIHKLDAPSGTAKTLAEVIDNEMHGNTEISSIRAGEIPGIHTICFEGLNDRLTIEHEAFNRRGFAEGAVLAAQMTENINGVHEFKELFLK